MAGLLHVFWAAFGRPALGFLSALWQACFGFYERLMAGLLQDMLHSVDATVLGPATPDLNSS